MPSTTRTEEKGALRAALRAAERALTAEERRESDRRLFARFLALPQVRAAECLLLFYGMGAEPDTRQLFAPLLAEGKRILLPRCQAGGGMELHLYRGEDHLTRHPYGMWEPSEDCPLLPESAAELALVPAMCYDRAGWRLGRGGGYYDRFLARYPGQTAGLCRDRLLQDRVPREPHDQRVQVVLTEHRTILGASQAPSQRLF